MKKLAAFVAFAAIAYSAAMASAASIDSAGLASIDIKTPAVQTTAAASSKQAVFDSTGKFTAEAVATVNPKVVPIKDESKVCLDSSCNTIL